MRTLGIPFCVLAMTEENYITQEDRDFIERVRKALYQKADDIVQKFHLGAIEHRKRGEKPFTKLSIKELDVEIRGEESDIYIYNFRKDELKDNRIQELEAQLELNQQTNVPKDNFRLRG